MPSYLVQVAYTSEAMAAMLKKPQDRAAVVGKAIAKLGGSLKSAWLTFGDYDTIVLVEMPDNVSAAAFAIGRVFLTIVGMCAYPPYLSSRLGDE